MPDFTLSDALAEAYASAPTDEVIVHTMELRHPDFSQPLRVVRGDDDMAAFLEDDAPENAGEEVSFVAVWFDFLLPEVTKGGAPEIEITIDAVNSEIIPYLDTASNSPDLTEVTYRTYLLSDLSGPQNNPPMTLVVRDIELDSFRARCRAGFADLANRKFPAETYTAERFPGLTS